MWWCENESDECGFSFQCRSHASKRSLLEKRRASITIENPLLCYTLSGVVDRLIAHGLTPVVLLYSCALKMLGRLVNLIFDCFVNATATFVSTVLEHPSVKKAGAAIIVQGMNDFLLQPDLDKHVLVMSETISRNQAELARKQGKDFPKVVGSFIQGMFIPERNERIERLSTPNDAPALVESKDEGSTVEEAGYSESPEVDGPYVSSFSSEEGVRKRVNTANTT